MNKMFYLLGILHLGLISLFAAPPSKVVLVVIDGIRHNEIMGTAKDDDGNLLSAESLFPEISKLKKQGAFLPNMEINNSSGKSLPGYADLFAGRRQEKIKNNEPNPKDFRSHYPTIFEVVKKGLGLDENGIALFASWKSICPISMSGEGAESQFFKSCGFENKKNLKPQIFEESRSDSDTFLELAQVVPEKHPQFIFVHFVDADEEAHQQKKVQKTTGVPYGVFHYHKAIRESDYLVGRIWKFLQKDPFYKDSTTMLITTDHGRDDDKGLDQLADHGNCLLCEGYKKIFMVATGPGIKPGLFEGAYGQTDIAPTVASLFGLKMNKATGKAISEIQAPHIDSLTP